jgi:hypothetical protein
MTKGVFAAGGAVQASGGIYIPRAADDALIDLCRQGVYAYILASRQMGKSSLMVHTSERLEAEGIRWSIVDLQVIGTLLSADQWYAGVLSTIAQDLELDVDVVSWWEARTHLSPAQRLSIFLSNVVLGRLPGPLVIFVDEIDATLSLPFADDFWGAIRSLYDARARFPVLNRLSFVFLGVASPIELVRDPRRTPYNIGRHVVMTDFTFVEAQQLTQGFPDSMHHAQADQTLRHILRWTHGHPYLTQRLCLALTESAYEWNRAGIRELVQHTFLGEASAKDVNLQEIKRMLTERATDPYAVLTTFRAILRSGPRTFGAGSRAGALLASLLGRRPVRDDPQSSVNELLKLSGVVRSDRSTLVVRNPIYWQVFDERWAKDQIDLLPTSWQQRFERARLKLAIVSALLLLMMTIAIGALWLRADTARAKALEAVQQEATQRAFAEAGALTLRAQAIHTKDRRLSFRMLLSALDLGAKLQVDQVLRQIIEPEPCVDLERRVYGAAWAGQGVPEIVVRSGDAAPAPRASIRLLPVEPPPGRAGGALLSPDGRSLVEWGAGKAQVRDAHDGATTFELWHAGRALRRAEWSPDGDRLLTLDSLGTVRLWNIAARAPLRTLVAGNIALAAAAWSPGGQRIALASDDGVEIWAVAGTVPSAVLAGDLGTVVGMAWSADGQQLTTASADGAVRRWEVRGGEPPLLQIAPQEIGITAAYWSPSGAYVMTIGADKAARVWDVSRGEQISRLDKAAPPIVAVRWSADAGRFLIAGASGVVCMHDAFDQLLATVNAEHVEKLSPPEKEQILRELLPAAAQHDDVAPETASAMPSEEPSPTHADTPTPTISPSAEPSPTNTPEPAPPADTPTEVPSAIPTDTPTLTPTNTPSITPSITPTATETEMPTATPTETPTDTSVSGGTTENSSNAGEATETPTETPTDTPSETPETDGATAEPSAEPAGSE